MRLLTYMLAATCLSGCASTVSGVDAAGRPMSIKVGYGNRITAPGYIIEPSEAVVNSAERTAQYTLQTAPQLITNIAAQGMGKL